MTRSPALSLAAAAAVCLSLCLPLAACTPPDGPRSFGVPVSDYARAFNASRDVLVEARFPLERVDARAGVLATAPKTTAGFASPEDGEQRTVGQEWQDLLNEQARVVRITFRPRTTDDGTASSAERGGGDVLATVEATILRARRPGSRVESESVQTSTAWRSAELAARGIEPFELVPLREDRPLAAELVRRIERRLAESAAAAAVGGAPPADPASSEDQVPMDRDR